MRRRFWVFEIILLTLVLLGGVLWGLAIIRGRKMRLGSEPEIKQTMPPPPDWVEPDEEGEKE
ncbi:hypothetical protein DRQ18_01565 [bacterium]|nr:MAG: hypothetical protein DRQ18_01565 [bacterium]